MSAVDARDIVEALAMLAVQGTVLALLAFAITRRMRPAWQAAVWLVVVAKFALPWGPQLPWSLADLFASVQGEPEAPVILWSAATAQTIEPVQPASAAWLVLLAIWAIGTSIVAARATLATLRTARAAARAPEAPAFVRELLPATRARIVIGDDAIGPHVVGILRPLIVIPRSLLADRTLLQAALLHELAHVRRLDALGRLVELAAVAMFWWLPVVRLARRRLDSAREAACDAWALSESGVTAPAYARLLLEMSRLGTAAAPALVKPRALSERVTFVLGPPVRPRLSRVHKLALVGWVALALGGARASAAQDPRVVCVYTLEIAEAIRLAHPQADLDGDGVLSHDEACEFQAEAALHATERAVPPGARQATPYSRALRAAIDPATAEILAEPLCCNCVPAEGPSSAALVCHAQE